jgi:mannosyltransferase OCH1-like enzyme
MLDKNLVLKAIKYHSTISLDERFKCLENLGEIPKIIHISWKSKNILENKNSMIVNGIANMKNINPDYDLQISDNNDVETYIKTLIPNKDYENIKNKHIVEKVDLWRLLKIYYEGGIYVDIDRYCNIPFKDIINSQLRCVLPTCRDLNFSQDIMISCKNNPIYFNVIQMNLNRRQSNPNKKLYYFGPITYMHAVTMTLYGKIYEQNIDRVLFNYLRHQLNHSRYFKSFREDGGGCDGFHRTLIYDHSLSTFQNGNGLSKREFYKEYNTRFWGEQ